MIATMSQQALNMPMSAPQQSSAKRPRLSLKIAGAGPAIGKSTTALKAGIDTTSPTAFNTLSNAYATAIENASPRSAKPPPSALSATTSTRPTSLRVVTNASSHEPILFPSQRTQTPGPFTTVYPDTPTTALTTSSPMTLAMESNDFTFTPPTSAHPINSPSSNKIFAFSSNAGTLTSPYPHGRRRAATLGSSIAAPYTHPLSLRSILRNSPLPKRAASNKVPPSPSRSSQRIANQASKKVGYNNPLTQTITTNRYVKSHVDLLMEDASPYSAVESEAGTLDLAMAYTGDETRDGGQTPGPFEEMRRRMAGLGDDESVDAGAEVDGGNGPKKRKRKEKSRQWVWTIGVNEEDGEDTKSPRALTPLTVSPAVVSLNPPGRGKKIPRLVLPSMIVQAKAQAAVVEILQPVAYEETEKEGQKCEEIVMTDMEEEEHKRPGTSQSV